MPMGYVFWLLMILWFIFGLWWNWPESNSGPKAFGPIGSTLLLFILLFLLGWKIFGFVVQG